MADKKKSLLPPSLKPGDTIGLISPAGLIKNLELVEAGIEILQNFGFQVKRTQLPQTTENYLAAKDSSRAHEFHNMWQDEQVAALMAIRGGFGCLRMIELLDMPFLQASPKLLIGFSDITVLLNGIWQKTGIVSLHGPVIQSLAKINPLSLQSFIEAVSGEMEGYNFSQLIEILRPGNSHGIIQGGNLTTIVHLLGTPWEISSNNAIVFLEDTGEPMYKIDRMLTQLSHCGKLKNLSGLILGSFGGENIENLENHRLQEQVWNRVLELTKDSKFPIWGNFPLGHQQENITLPIGLPTDMNSNTGTLFFNRC